MKNLKKIFMTLGCVMMISIGLTGCGSKTSSQIEAEAQEVIRAEHLKDVESTTEVLATLLKNTTYDKFEEAVEGGTAITTKTFDNDLGNRWSYFTEQHGAVTETQVLAGERTEEGFSDRIILTGEDEGQMLLTIQYNKSLTPISSSIGEYSDDSQETMGSKMATAGTNTATGVLVVFVVLIGLSLIISCFKFVGKIGTEVKPQNKDAKKAAPAVKAAAPVAKAAASQEVDLAKEQELVAVIMAAIAASEEKPVEGYVVRSIKRLHNNKWR